MIETLTNRLIAIKNEILALKTSHKHGLGSMKLWSYKLDPPSDISTDFFGDVYITVTVAADSAPFPLIDISCSDFDGSFQMGVDVSNDGMVFEYHYETNTNPSFTVVTSSEASISSRWEPYNG